MIDLAKIHSEATRAANKATQAYIQESLCSDPDSGPKGVAYVILESYYDSRNNKFINLNKHKSFIDTMVSLGVYSILITYLVYE